MADTLFGSAARGELQCTRLECRTVVICPENGSFLRKDCAGWCRGLDWWKKQAARDAGAAGLSEPALWPRLLAAPRPTFSHVRHRSPSPSPFRRCHLDLCRQPRTPKPYQRLGTTLVFPAESGSAGPHRQGEQVRTRVIAFGAEPLGGVALGSRATAGSCCPEMETE